MRFFNTTGPVRPQKHYSIPPLGRIDLDDVLSLIRSERYFVLHAPRQTGKTSTLLALRDLLNSGSEGEFRCVYANVEAGQAAREDLEQAMRAILDELASRARATLGDEFLEGIWPAILARSGPAGALRNALTRWAEADSRPLVLLVDEIDALVGDTLLSALRQLGAGYDRRPEGFPQLLLQAFLQRIVNGGGRIEREYGLGRRRTDLLVVWPQGGRNRRFVVECKILRKSLERTIGDGLEQTAGYMDRCGAEAGHLVIFDRDEGKSWEERLFRRVESAGGADIHVWGM